MKGLLAICLIVAAPFAWAGEKPAPASATAAAAAPLPPAAASVKGEVLEILEVDSYTYLRLKTKDGETWAAVAKAPVKKGAQVTVENAMVMNNFESKSLKRTFPTILFGSLPGAAGAAPAMGHGAGAKPAVDTEHIKVSKATGPNARTVAEIVTKAAELKDKPVVVRGKVVKFNPEIMGKNWVHLRDGTGSAEKNSNDILVTTAGQAKPGDVVTVKGTVRTDKDFGSGYAYKVMIEEATLQP
ncbi:MAG: hypothetical protein PHU46_06060 [Rhodocyclaceae bacterium]|nr:hypothetical protein [Rhodocyclaceae bacterium]